MVSQIEKEFEEFDRNQRWPIVYQKIKNEASINSITEEHSVGEARKPENRSKNRYRDVSPYDHSRVILQKGESDYINASLTQVPECKRRYILSQGPLEHTAAQFWQMVWEQETKAIIMLNRVIEKGALKCHQYWPLGEDDDDDDDDIMVFEETGLKVTLLEVQGYNHYIVRTIELEYLKTEQTREVFHFHYVTWPDFGVPSSPVSFLSFLDAVREQGVLEEGVGPAVIHCSAGIGRSGTFCLVDSALILIEKTGTLCGIDVKSLLLSMRTFRMGLIQTPEQLRFSYLAIIEGAKRILGTQDTGADEVNDVLENYMDMSGGRSKGEEMPPTPPQRTSSLSPTKGRERPPPPPPRRLHSEEKENLDEPPEKISKHDDDTTDIPQKSPTVDSPEKPPRSFSVETSDNDNITRTVLDENETVPNKPVSENKHELDTENNNPIVDNKHEGTKEAGDKLEGHGHTDDQGGNGDHEAGHLVQGHELPEDTEHQSTGNSVTEGQSETQLRQRRREERKKTTQEMIENMKKKQRQSETWKKRKSFYKPIAIGLSILLGGYLLYKFYWS